MKACEGMFKAGMLVALVAIPATLTALVLPWWAYTEIDFFGETWKSNIGLWKWCRETIDVNNESTNACRSFKQPDGYIVTSRCLLVFAFIFLLLGLLAVSAQRWYLQELIFLAFLGPVILCIAGCLSWLATVSYIENYVKTPGNQPRDIHAGWMMALASSAFSFLSGTLFAAGRIKDK